MRVTPKPTNLTPEELSQVLDRVDPNGKEFATARICRMLADQHSVETMRLGAVCCVSNVSDRVYNGINPKIADLGMYVTCERPMRAIVNRLGLKSKQMVWSFYKDEAANDAYFDSQDQMVNKLKRDLELMQKNNPFLELPDDEWIAALKKIDVSAMLRPVR